MKSALRFALITLLFVGCRAGDSTTPIAAVPGRPSFAVSDGANSGGNKDFFSLPPMAKDPSTNPNYQANAFNPNLKPRVSICALAATSAAAVNASTLCKSSGYKQDAPAAVSDEQYAYNWDVPRGGDLYYRVSVYVGTKRLGFTDVATDKSESFVQANDGRTLPIKFRIEQYALCAVPGTGPCASKTIDLALGGTVSATIGGSPAGVNIPPQPNGFVTTVTSESCSDLNPSVTDLPIYGPCVRVTASPALPPSKLTNAATVFICAVGPTLLGSMSHDQTERVTMHRYDPPVSEGAARFAALPHAPACNAPVVVGSVTGLVRAVAQGAFASAGRELFAMIAPKRLNAATRRLDVGPGAFTDEFSDFQFALPSTLTIVAGDGQTGAPGAQLLIAPSVKVTDLGGEPVPNARVRFAASTGACAGASTGTGTLSNASGIVTDGPWTIVAGANTRVACGRGLAGTDNNGPRVGVVDPFQPLSMHFGDTSNGLEVSVLTGSVQFTATGIVLPATLVNFLGSGYVSYGGTQPAGWPLRTSGGSSASAPFNGASIVCTITAVAGPSTFPANTDLFVTKTFTVPVAGTLTTTIRIDNDVKVYVDGSDITSSLPPSLPLPSNGAYSTSAGFWKHENCADSGPLVFSLSVTAGTHTISLWAHDRGTVGYLDLQMVLSNP